MFSVERKSVLRRALALGAVFTLGLGASGAAVAQSMVVRSVGPSAAQYPAGKKLPANTKIVLKASDKVTVLDKAGTRVLSGPGSFTLDGAVKRDQTQSTQIASLLSTGGPATRSRTGAVRGAPAKVAPATPRSPSLWFIDASQSGKFCVAEPARLMFWRANVAEDAELKLAGTGAAATIAWKKGSGNRLWPMAEVPVTSGTSYTITGTDGVARKIDLVVLPSVPTEVDEIAGTLIENGCENQLGLLVETMAAVAQDSETSGDR
ncbi:hypothetical protein C7451_11331 [Blastomonas natatoria]|uniref:Uncharacterized protein n=1 Tax=Blastomonas natatoria TaxID=34015 RepID=A0A2V3V692_9SPHN|nr:hypothetical protein [Blastomonas natatoria]PXW71285.1 hypothetical protein C7451_11331 [Blastomonas natatoria]